MNSGIEALTTTSLSLALDAASLRHQVIAANIANAGSRDFVPQRLSFEAQLDNAMRGTTTVHRESNSDQVAVQLNVRIEPDVGPDGRPRQVGLDTEVAAMSQNSLHYQALLKGLNRHLSVLATAVSEGKR